MGPEPLYRSGPGNFPAQGRVRDHREAAKEAGGRGLGLTPAGVSDGGGGFLRDLGINQKETEYGHEIYCDATYSGPQ